MSAEKYPWPQWQLTAFVLDELKPNAAAPIQAAADRDPALAAEIAAIRAAINQVAQLYKQETAGIEPTQFVAAATPAAAATGAVMPAAATQPSKLRRNWTAAIGLLAMGASLLIAVALAAPALRTYFATPMDVLANAPEPPSRTDRPTADRKMAALAENDGALLDKNRFSVAEAVADRVAELDAVPTTSPLLAANTQNKRRSVEYEQIESRTEEGFIDALNDADQPAAPAASTESLSLALPPSQASASQEQVTQLRSIQESEAKLFGMDAGGDAGSGAMLSRSANAPKGTELGQLGAAAGMGGMGMGGMGMGGMGMGGMGMAGGSVGEEAMGGMPGVGAGGMMGGMGMGMPMDTAPQAFYRREALQTVPGADGSDGEALAQETEWMHRGRSQRRNESQSTQDRYAPIYENSFKSVESEPLSTFSIDVDTASYTKARQYLLQSRTLPPANAVRVEEFINYFEYEYAGPQGDAPFAADLAVANCPWRSDHKLVRIALQASKLDVSERPKANIVFLLDVSGSMDQPNKLPLVKESMRMLIQQLGENDRVAMVVYAGAAGCVLESTTGDHQEVILGALDRLSAGGSTNGGQGIQLAYDLAREHFTPGGINRVILCTDGDFNVGTTSTKDLVNLVVDNAKSKVFLTVLGYGMGNTNDAMLEQISNRGNGVYGFVDSRREAQRQMVKQLAGNLMTVAKDVKIQVEFNPQRVAAYRLIGYENRLLAKEDFANDKKDAGEIGAGHRVTALYEIEPVGGREAGAAPEEELRYQKRLATSGPKTMAQAEDETSQELLAVKLRYKQPEGDTSQLLTFPLNDSHAPFAEADDDFRWAATVAQFAMLLRNSAHKGNSNWSRLLEQADQAAGDNPEATRQECLDLIRIAAGLSGM